jgi:hypothetical protein
VALFCVLDCSFVIGMDCTASFELVKAVKRMRSDFNLQVSFAGLRPTDQAQLLASGLDAGGCFRDVNSNMQVRL